MITLVYHLCDVYIEVDLGLWKDLVELIRSGGATCLCIETLIQGSILSWAATRLQAMSCLQVRNVTVDTMNVAGLVARCSIVFCEIRVFGMKYHL